MLHSGDNKYFMYIYTKIHTITTKYSIGRNHCTYISQMISCKWSTCMPKTITHTKENQSNFHKSVAVISWIKTCYKMEWSLSLEISQVFAYTCSIHFRHTLYITWDWGSPCVDWIHILLHSMFWIHDKLIWYQNTCIQAKKINKW